MQRRRDLIPLLILILSSASLCLAQSRRPTTDATAPNLSGMGQGLSIRGTVRLASTEQTLEMVQVDLVHSYGDLVATSITRANGDFEFSGITPGNYALVIAMRGYEPVRENVQLNGSRYGVVLYMREVPRAVSEETDYKVSQRELTREEPTRQPSAVPARRGRISRILRGLSPDRLGPDVSEPADRGRSGFSEIHRDQPREVCGSVHCARLASDEQQEIC